MKTKIVLIVEHKKPIPDLADLAAARAYTLSGVDGVEIESAQVAPVWVAPKAETWVDKLVARIRVNV